MRVSIIAVCDKNNSSHLFDAAVSAKNVLWSRHPAILPSTSNGSSPNTDVINGVGNGVGSAWTTEIKIKRSDEKVILILYEIKITQRVQI